MSEPSNSQSTSHSASKSIPLQKISEANAVPSPQIPSSSQQLDGLEGASTGLPSVVSTTAAQNFVATTQPLSSQQIAIIEGNNFYDHSKQILESSPARCSSHLRKPVQPVKYNIQPSHIPIANNRHLKAPSTSKPLQPVITSPTPENSNSTDQPGPSSSLRPPSDPDLENRLEEFLMTMSSKPDYGPPQRMTKQQLRDRYNSIPRNCRYLIPVRFRKKQHSLETNEQQTKYPNDLQGMPPRSLVLDPMSDFLPNHSNTSEEMRQRFNDFNRVFGLRHNSSIAIDLMDRDYADRVNSNVTVTEYRRNVDGLRQRIGQPTRAGITVLNPSARVTRNPTGYDQRRYHNEPIDQMQSVWGWMFSLLKDATKSTFGAFGSEGSDGEMSTATASTDNIFSSPSEPPEMPSRQDSNDDSQSQAPPKSPT